MMPDLFDAIDRAREELLEARCLVRRDREALGAQIDVAIALLRGLLTVLGGRHALLLDRLGRNLDAGLPWTWTEPSVLEGYIDGARWELLCLRERLQATAARSEATR